MLTLGGYLMRREEDYPPTPEMLADANLLLLKVEGLFYDLGIELYDTGISSGYRPGIFNEAAGGTKNSAHLLCMAIDIKDASKKITKKILEAPHLLEKWGLYMEDPSRTPNWVHLQTRPTRKRIFLP